ncbi:hypothetical protein [Pseudogemmobacter sp. W21_MBD1_M6]|uniref:hypothetical protein n=1 Tax=Pseudogemmobacter sp. W21_MBD1_M6 TaxID=3240271 RepID=UPI003F9C7094
MLDQDLMNIFAEEEKIVRPRRPDRFETALRDKSRRRLRMSLLDGQAAFAHTPAPVEVVHDALDASYLKATENQSEQVSPSIMDLMATPREPRPIQTYNDFNRIRAALYSNVDIIPPKNSDMSDQMAVPASYEDRRGTLATRLTVYTINATLMVIAFPIGFGVLMFNILGGENLRATAHAMSITGTAIGLMASGAPDMLMKML